MGYRANLVTQHREYGRNVFYNYGEFQVWLSFVREKYDDSVVDNIYESEQEDYYEIPREIFEAEIKRLKEQDPDAIDKYVGMENKYAIEVFEKALEEAIKGDDFITLEWY